MSFLDGLGKLAGDLLGFVRSLWTRLARQGFDPATLSQLRWSLTTSCGLRFATSTELAVAMFENWSLGWPLETLAQYPTDLRTTTPAELRAAFAACRDTTTAVALGDPAALESAFSGPPR